MTFTRLFLSSTLMSSLALADSGLFILLGGTNQAQLTQLVDLRDNPSTSCVDTGNLPSGSADSPVVGAVVNGKLTACDTETTTCYQYDPSNAAYGVAPFSLITGRGFSGNVDIRERNTWFLAGGSSENVNLASTEVFNKNTNSFQPSRFLPLALNGSCVAQIDENTLFLSGGQNQAGNSISQAYFITLDDNNAATFTAIPSMPTPRAFHACAYDKESASVFVIGPDSSVEAYKVATGTWRNGPNFPKEAVGASAKPFGDNFVVHSDGDFYGYSTNEGFIKLATTEVNNPFASLVAVEEDQIICN